MALISYFLAISILQAMSTPIVTTSYDLLKSSGLSTPELTLGKKHQWLLINHWDSHSHEAFASSAEKLVRWRTRDLANETSNGDSQSQKSLYFAWLSQLKHSPTNSVMSGLKDVLDSLGPQYFPILKDLQVKWIKVQSSDFGKFAKPTSLAIANLFDISSQKWNSQIRTVYIRMERVSNRLDVRLMAVNDEGTIVGDESLFLKDVILETGTAPLAKEIFPTSVVSSFKRGTLNEVVPVAPVLPKDFNLQEIEKLGFAQWVARRLNLNNSQNGVSTAMLVSDSDLINFSKSGGSFELYLKSKGYVVVKADGVQLVLPPRFEAAENSKISEELIKQISRQNSCAAILSEYARWVSSSHLNCFPECHEYVAQAIHSQIGISDLLNYAGPLCHIFDNSAELHWTTSGALLAGTNLGRRGNQLIQSQTFDGFSPLPKASQESQISYHFGQPGSEELTRVAVKIEPSQLILFSEVSELPMEIPLLQEYFDRYGSTADEIIRNLASKPVKLVSSDRVTLTFTSSFGRELTTYFLIPRATGESMLLENMPKMLYSGLKDMIRYWVQANDYIRSLGPPPPPRESPVERASRFPAKL